MSSLPNILFLMMDEHRADVTGYEGNTVIRTPTLDTLAKTGVVFRNAYTPSPICVPGRQCMMAGQLPKTCGCEGWVDLKPGYMTFARQLARRSYMTVACGKLHHVGTDQMQGWCQRIGNEMVVSQAYIEDKVAEVFRENVRPFSDYKWSDAKEIARAGVGRAPNVAADEYAVEGALQFIDEYFNNSYYDREQGSRPLLLKVSLIQPHYPYSADEAKFGYYLNRVTPYLNQTVSDHPFLSERRVTPGVDASVRELTRATAAYYSMIETADNHFARVLAALESVGQKLDEWIIIYTSDHGEMLGEHGIWEKQKFYEGSVRVPLVIRWPAHLPGGRVATENVNLCDLFATLCDLTGIPIPGNLDSRSLAPILRGQSAAWFNESVSEFSRANVPLPPDDRRSAHRGSAGGGDVVNLMIKHDDLKYQYYGPEMPEVLFDLGRDPAEETDYSHDRHYADAMGRFRARARELGFMEKMA